MFGMISEKLLKNVFIEMKQIFFFDISFIDDKKVFENPRHTKHFDAMHYIFMCILCSFSCSIEPIRIQGDLQCFDHNLLKEQ